MTDARRSEWPFRAVIAAMFAASAAVWTRVPTPLPIHWNAAGEVDGWGNRGVALLTVPIAAVAIDALLRALPRIDPGGENYRSFPGAYRAARLALLVVLAGVHAVLVASALGFRFDVVRVVFAGVGVLHVVLGGVMGKLRPNWFIGIRTPWTLSSKRSWVRTHRVAGVVFVLGGAAMTAAALLRPSSALAAIFAFALGPYPVLIGYSWWVWRRDPERLPPAGTRPAEDGSTPSA
jgi:uncharacterized membrane protein